MGTLTTGEVGLLAPVVGGALVVGGSWLTRVWNRNDDAARWKREDTIATRDRIRAAYFGLVDECVAAKRVLQWQPDDETIPDELFDVMQNVDRHALVIPDTEIRAQVENLSGIMWQADRIAPSLPVAKTPNTVAFEAAAGLDDLACALIRGEPLPELPWYVERISLLDQAFADPVAKPPPTSQRRGLRGAADDG